MGLKQIIKQRIFNVTSDTRDIMEWHFRKIEEKLAASQPVQSSELSSLKDEMQRLHKLLEQSIQTQQEHTEQIERKLDEVTSALQREMSYLKNLSEELHMHIDYFEHDVLQAFAVMPIEHNPLQTEPIHLKTDYPVAIHSNDHLHPHGTAHDNTRAPFFIRRCEELFPQKKSLKYMDIGCSGGGIVLDALIRGHFAVGLEGSDFSLKHQRAEWRVIRNNLFTCDVTHPFELLDQKEQPVHFDVISAWEVLEHIPESDVAQLIENISAHMEHGGIFVGTVSQVHDIDPVSGADWHVTLQPPEWWEEQFAKAGFHTCKELFDTSELARAYGNPPLPWLLNWGIEGSPYIAMKKLRR